MVAPWLFTLFSFNRAADMVKNRRIRQYSALGVGALLGTIYLFWLALPQGETLLMPGPNNIGHEDIYCSDCHSPAEGSFRQQLQAKLQHWLGYRAIATEFGRQPVTNRQCAGCHKRPDDRHPVYRFFEPRYREVRKNLKPQFCISCHTEHSGARVTLVDIGYCRECHQKLRMKEDPLNISHADLVEAERWSTCLGCHDFHGNHEIRAGEIVADAFSKNIVEAYFKGGPSPYGDKKIYQASRRPRQ